ncbi:hypothetical protein [Novosphingobium sp. SG720]|uniref:hypothetical protein n=1 Tax=Novosphingobium sp. SG720 TaxID=2586998 RepID=UPI001444D025|nr:hypothetical protein [Novosphingobium sp. SG720]NKJ42197.1 DNA-binding FadR family transcriptional regulator [Novosphingobium sp. SG720]
MADLTRAGGADELQRISACMLGALDPASLAHEAVHDMEMGLLRQGWPVGQSLGALPDVRKRLGLGRPAFREAITILEARGLLDVRRGPGGGLFVAAPALEDIVGAVLMYLALAGETRAAIEEFRKLVWRMVASAAIRRRIAPVASTAPGASHGFAVALAEQTGNTTMVLLARLAEMLVRTAAGREAPDDDAVFAEAVCNGNLAAAIARLDVLGASDQAASPIISLEIAERAFSLSGRKSAMALAARLTRELSGSPASQEAEWQTAMRLGYTDAVVRQARRILQDFGIVRCRQGRKGAELAPPAAPTGVIRLLAPCLMASATSPRDNREAISLLVSGAPGLAAARQLAGRLVAPALTVPKHDAFEALTLENLLLDLSGNALLAMVVRSLGVASVFLAADPMPPVDRGDVIALNRRILAAIQAGDVAAADALAQLKLDVMQPLPEVLRAVA